jgi:Mn2+/Fe2+ NRAMP family transporter
MYFIILATAATVHRTQPGGIETARQAAEALRPLAGEAAYLLYGLGLVGTGLLAIPILAGSASFALAEVFRWPAGLAMPARRAPRFYLVLAGAVLTGMGLTVLQRNPVHVLFLSALLNGLLAPPLLALVMLVGGNRRIMGAHVSGRWLTMLGWAATGVMTAAALAFLFGGR